MPPLSHNARTSWILLALACLTFVYFPILVSAQSVPCKASLRSLPAAPELKGFQLGMTMEQIKAIAPQIVFGKTDSLGSSKTSISPAFDPNADKSKFQDVRTVSLDLLDGRVVSLWIGYDTNFKWSTVPAFVTGISQSLSLPNAWTDWKSRGQQMTCSDFEVTVSMIAQSPSLKIVDTVAAQTLDARRTAAAEETEASESETEETELGAEEFIGDRKSKIYYLPTCQPEKEISEENRVVFKSASDAVKAGYKKGC